MKKTFEIEYKIGYGPLEDYNIEKVKAINTKEALRIFANRKKIPREELSNFENWMWEEGLWFAFFKKIRELSIGKS
ncbi:MAG: hypothetical protein M3R36_03965 [Bacteroidota bacterium]|nr:hypothetical protein [Bacteroidota bacterium]